MDDRSSTQDYLLAIAIGPVQEFIAASRKARDLWAGSDLLSSLCRAAAIAIAGPGWKDDPPPVGPNTLIFPTIGSLRGNHAVANKLLVSTTRDPAAVATAAREAVREALEAAWKVSFHDDERMDLNGRISIAWRRDPKGVDLAQAQRDDFIEFYAAWTPYEPETRGDYTRARERVERLLAGRKRLREFSAAPMLPGRPKSSLDPARESVITIDQQRRADVRRVLHLSENEFLDAVSLLKRFHGADPGSGAGRFPSTSRVSIDPFIRAASVDPSLLAQARAAAEIVATTDLAEAFDAHGNLAHYSAFPFDCQLLYDAGPQESRRQIERWFEQAIMGEVQEPTVKAVSDWLLANVRDLDHPARQEEVAQWIAHEIGGRLVDLPHTDDAVSREGSAAAIARQLIKAHPARDAAGDLLEKIVTLKDRIASERGEPWGELPTYYAILLADGDRMGAALGLLDKAEEHQAFSTELGTFAEKAGDVVRKHFGAMIYAGGDDTLAFLPLDTALPCADTLSREFSAMIARAEGAIAQIRGLKTFSFEDADSDAEKKPTKRKPTLSVGLAVGHYSEHLQAMLDRARIAERRAKVKRNSLAVSFGSRSGGGDVRIVSHDWCEQPLAKVWAPAIDGHRRSAFPDGAAYELQALYSQWKATYLRPDGSLRAKVGAHPVTVPETVLAKVLRDEVERILKRKKIEDTADIARILVRLDTRSDSLAKTLVELQSVVDELIIARRIAPLLADDRSAAVAAWNAHEHPLLRPRVRAGDGAVPQQEGAA